MIIYIIKASYNGKPMFLIRWDDFTKSSELFVETSEVFVEIPGLFMKSSELFV